MQSYIFYRQSAIGRALLTGPGITLPKEQPIGKDGRKLYQVCVSSLLKELDKVLQGRSPYRVEGRERQEELDKYAVPARHSTLCCDCICAAACRPCPVEPRCPHPLYPEMTYARP